MWDANCSPKFEMQMTNIFGYFLVHTVSQPSLPLSYLLLNPTMMINGYFIYTLEITDRGLLVAGEIKWLNLNWIFNSHIVSCHR